RIYGVHRRRHRQRTKLRAGAPARAIVVEDHNFDAMRRRATGKRDEIEANRGVHARISSRSKLVRKDYRADQPLGAAVAVIDYPVIVNDNARLVIAVNPTGTRRNRMNPVDLRLVILPNLARSLEAVR